MTVEYDREIFEEEIPSDVFTFKESLKARWKEIKHSISLLRKSFLFLVGFFMMIGLIVLALLAPVLAPYGAQEYAVDQLKQTTYVREPPLTPDIREYLYWSPFNDVSNQFGISQNILIRSWATDLNQDGKIDILVGTSKGELKLYRNQGKGDSDNTWVLDTTYTLPTLPSNLNKIVPAAGDLNGDGITDIVIGGDDGRVYLSLNQGSAASPNWTPFTPIKDQNGTEILLPGLANPALVNFDSDDNDTLDLVVSSTDNKIYVYQNVGTQSQYAFKLNPDMPKDSSDNPMKLSNLGTGSLRVLFGLINNDERLDMILIYESGQYYFYSSFGYIKDPNFAQLDKKSPSVTFRFPEIKEEEKIDFIWKDLTGDNRSDIVVFHPTNGKVEYAYQYLKSDPRIHIFGTDEKGGDIFSRCLWALQVDLLLALWVVTGAVVIGTLLGATAGYYGGWIDQLLMRITDVFFAFPGLILAMAIAAALGRNMFNLSIALIVVWWAGYARIIRGQVIAEKNKLYVEAARATGLRNTRIILFHVLPNSIYPILVAATLDLGGVMLTAAGLSFIGFGANPGDAELGRMVADGRRYLAAAPWIIFFPGLFIFISVLAFNLIGDGIRDVLDPRIRR